MRTGITQDQVNAAADALVAAGDKPTVEKVRAALGTGSPNTVTRMLEVWRNHLAERLQQVLQLPELPPEAGQAMTELWRLAVAHADRLLQTRLTETRDALAAEATHMAEERVRWTATLADAQAAVTQAQAQRELSEQACTNLDNQLRDSHALRDDLVQQRDRLQALCDRQVADLEVLQREKNAWTTAAVNERERVAEHVRAVEDRAHKEVDRTRQELQSFRQQLEVQRREHAKDRAQTQRQHETLQHALKEAEKAAAHHAGRADALEVARTKGKSVRAASKRGKQAPAKKPRRADRA